MNPKDEKLQNILTVVAVFSLILFVASCDRLDCWGGTLEGKQESYKGKPEALEAYMDEATLSVGPGSCDSYTKHCGYFPLAKVKVHNPTDKEVVVDIECKFFVGSWEAHTTRRKDVKVAAKGSKWVDLQGNLSVEGGRENSIGVVCDAFWK